jgi:hypothetical protein
MSNIHESLTVLCPFDQVPEAAAHYVSTRPARDGKAIVTLRVTVGDLLVERRADLTLTESDASAAIMDISWSAHDGGPYPIFRGTLSVVETGGNFCRLDLDGGYVPPLGLAGAVFDAVLGHRIAVAAARELLDDIRIGVEFVFQTGATLV